MKKSINFRYISLITLFALLMNVMLPFFAVYNINQAMALEAQKSSDEEISSLFGEKILICTSEGFKFVSIKDLKNNNQEPKPHQEYQCAICYLAANTTKHLVNTEEIELVYENNIQYISYSFINDIVASAIFKSGSLTRAPPQIA